MDFPGQLLYYRDNIWGMYRARAPKIPNFLCNQSLKVNCNKYAYNKNGA